MAFKVRLIKDLVKWKRAVEGQLAKGNRRNERTYKLLINGINTLKRNYKAGSHLSRRKHRKAFEYYNKKYGIENLWKLNVSRDWRMIYTVVGNEVEVISFILEMMDHKRYNKRFGYKKG